MPGPAPIAVGTMPVPLKYQNNRQNPTNPLDAINRLLDVMEDVKQKLVPLELEQMVQTKFSAVTTGTVVNQKIQQPYNSILNALQTGIVNMYFNPVTVAPGSTLPTPDMQFTPVLNPQLTPFPTRYEQSLTFIVDAGGPAANGCLYIQAY